MSQILVQDIYTYNEDKLCVKVTDPLGDSIFHEYIEYIEPYRDIDEEGNLTDYSYDEKGNLKAITAPDSAITEITLCGDFLWIWY